MAEDSQFSFYPDGAQPAGQDERGGEREQEAEARQDGHLEGDQWQEPYASAWHEAEPWSRSTWGSSWQKDSWWAREEPQQWQWRGFAGDCEGNRWWQPREGDWFWTPRIPQSPGCWVWREEPQQSRQWRGDAGDYEGSRWGSSREGDWFWTPQCWVWGESLDKGIQASVERGWIDLDDSFCAWWKAQSSPAVSASPKPSESGDSREELEWGQAWRSRDGQSSSHGTGKKNTGKDVIPAYDGQTTMREYERRVRLFQSTTGIDAEYQAGKLVEKLSGEAWHAVEMLDLKSLRCEDGVDKLLKHLWGELEPLEYLRVFNTLSYFFKSFRRQTGQEFTAYDTAFRAQCKRLAECHCPLEGIGKAYWFLEKAAISDELRRQVVSSAGGEYDYARLRQALVAIVPQVRRANDEHGDRSNLGKPRWPTRDKMGSKSSSRVHMVGEADPEHHDGAAEPVEEVPASDQECDEMEYEAEVLLTHAARKRAEAEKNRGFNRPESTQDREKRIQEMKKRMPCAACKANGKTVYGHWHSDEVCPFHKSKAKDKSVFVVTTEEASESDDSESAFFINAVQVWSTMTGVREETALMALADTCCAKTVVGEKWLTRHLEELESRGLPFYLVRDAQPFRFGAGPKVTSQYAVWLPLFLPGTEDVVVLKACTVKENVPLLISSVVLQDLGAMLDMGRGKYHFTAMSVTVPMIRTASGHIGFTILTEDAQERVALSTVNWAALIESQVEVSIAHCGGEDRVNISTPENSQGSPNNSGVDNWSVCVQAGSTADAFHISTADIRPKPSSSAHSRERAIQHELQSERAHGQDWGAEAEGGVRPSTGGSDSGSRAGVEDLDSGEATLDLSSCEAREGAGPACQLEEIPEASSHGALRDRGAAGRGRSRSEASVLESGSLDRRAEPLCPADGGIGRGQRGGSACSLEGSALCEVQDPNGREGEQGHKGAILRMPDVPNVSGDLSHDVREPASSDGPGPGGSRRAAWWQAAWQWVRQDHVHRRQRGDERGDDPPQSPRPSVRSQLGVSEAAASGFGCAELRGPDVSVTRGGEADCSGEGQGRGPEGCTGGEEHVSPKGPGPLPESEVRKRIRQGQAQRRLAKQGTCRRLLGNCKSLASKIFLTSLVAMTSVGSAFQAKFYGDVRPDVLELFGEAAEVSLQFARRGWNVMSPIDITYEHHDLGELDVRRRLLERVDHERPRLIIISYPCDLWKKLTATPFRSSQDRRRQMKLRSAQEPFLSLCEELFARQLDRGDDALAEHPLLSQSLPASEVSRVLCRPDVHLGVGYGCQFGGRQRPTLWACTSPEMSAALSLQNVDAWARHGGQLSRHTRGLPRAIHTGFVKTLQRKEPSRVRRLLIAVKHRLTHGNPENLKWSLGSVHQALNPSGHEAPDTTVWAVESTASSSSMPVVPCDSWVGSETECVFFDVPAQQKLDGAARAVLKKLHTNLGHPSRDDLRRFMKSAGASQALLDAVGWLRCTACAKSQRPQLHRHTRLPPHDLQFNDQVMVDCFHVKDGREHGHWFMSMLDRATMFHVVSLIPNHSPEAFVRVFLDHWIKWAGSPVEVSIDLETGFGGVFFADQLGKGGTRVLPIAGQAHWQHGKVERHGGILKDIIARVVAETTAWGPENMKIIGDEAANAKNSLIREHGFSPAQLLFGREPRMVGELHENGEACAFHFQVGDQGTQVAKRMKYRHHARLAFVHAQASALLHRTARNKTRPWKDPQLGDKCFFFREIRQKGVVGKVPRWLGPGLVVGLQGSSNVWVVFGGRCYLVAQEHCREAVGEEALFGRPEVQEAIAIFKDESRDKRFQYEDLADTRMPQDGDLDMPALEEFDDYYGDDMMDADADAVPQQVQMGAPGIVKDPPDHVKAVAGQSGWHQDSYGNPVHVAARAYAFRTPGGTVDAKRFPVRSSWGFWDGKWRLLEDDVRWTDLEDPNGLIPGGPAFRLVTVFSHKTRKQICLDSVPESLKKKARVDHVFMTLARRKAQKALDKEVPFSRIPEQDMEAYMGAERKEWQSWLDYDAVEVVPPEQAQAVLEKSKERVLKSRYVYRNKNAGLVDKEGKPLPLKPKARLCVAGQHCPDCASGEVKVDSPTVQHATLLTFLHCVISFGWVDHWRSGDISSAFLQGSESKGNPLYMFPPERGLPDVPEGSILRLKRPVYGRPDAPRAWFEQLSGFIVDEMGYEMSLLDPAFFIRRDAEGKPTSLLIIHVDDLMVCTNGHDDEEAQVQKLLKRFPFGEWDQLKEVRSVVYCGKEVVLDVQDGQEVIKLRQQGFVEGRLELIPLSKERRSCPDEAVTTNEQSDFRSVLGALQWLSTQSRPDISLEVNQLQKRVNSLQVRDLEKANSVARMVKRTPVEIVFKNLGSDVAVVSYHDAGLFNSVGVELDERDDEIVQSLGAQKLLYSQKGSLIGLVRREDLERTVEVPMNIVAWRSKTNKRIVESSFAAETHASIMGYDGGHYQRMLLAEINFGSWVVRTDMPCDLHSLVPLVMVTDCRSLYDCVNKNGQSVGDRGNTLNACIVRQLCTTDKAPPGAKARLMWVPTRHQYSDGLTKSGKGQVVQELCKRASVQFHGVSARRQGHTSERTEVSVKDVSMQFADV